MYTAFQTFRYSLERILFIISYAVMRAAWTAVFEAVFAVPIRQGC